jgi:hypothetical protein
VLARLHQPRRAVQLRLELQRLGLQQLLLLQLQLRLGRLCAQQDGGAVGVVQQVELLDEAQHVVQGPRV